MKALLPYLYVYSDLSASLFLPSGFCVFLKKMIKYPSVFFSTTFIVLSTSVVLFLHLAFNPPEMVFCVGSICFHRFKMKEMSSVYSLTYQPGLGKCCPASSKWDRWVTGPLFDGSPQGRAGCAGEQPL